ncbi:hypothetical protein PoB_005896100 [Plakobranchus ocellatus]|uniref:Uncharacterized protein n=1 Tax=Plakobranchus ocellatus TaxID=259542 RepID=A0AAV4CAX7_9GAST|nr:hypothetical protein PoB_005896100 [Plakobranchus ocellatus]
MKKSRPTTASQDLEVQVTTISKTKGIASVRFILKEVRREICRDPSVAVQAVPTKINLLQTVTSRVDITSASSRQRGKERRGVSFPSSFSLFTISTKTSLGHTKIETKNREENRLGLRPQRPSLTQPPPPTHPARHALLGNNKTKQTTMQSRAGGESSQQLTEAVTARTSKGVLCLCCEFDI